jgi:2,3-bisphosphoglycerate-independent phosphoglycerate mutase
MGNSEVGHLNIGAGRVVYMDITKVDLMVEKGELQKNPVLINAMKTAHTDGHSLHLFGLLSDGGVHSHQEHLYALLRMAKENGVERVFVHCWMDGRDTPPTSGSGYVEQLEQKMREYGIGKIASVTGRYYVMDRDKRWERVAKGFNAMVTGDGDAPKYTDAVKGVKEAYNRGETDEFIIPFVCVNDRGEAVGPIRDGDTCICFNFRADRAREITRALTRNSGLDADGGSSLPDSAGLDAAIPRDKAPKGLHYVCLTQYDAAFQLPVVIPPEELHNILANVMGDMNLRNLRCAETEKYAHVTFFFNGGQEQPFKGEERILVPSPKVATYDLQPEMSAPTVCENVVNGIEKGAFDVIVVNFANPDMVGHSGKLEPAIKAVETVDICLGNVYKAVKQSGGAMIVTADHGNAEMMVDPVTGGPHTYHTTNPVPFIVVADGKFKLHQDGSLQDIAPTMLGMLGLPQPKEMTGKDLRIMQ